MTERKLVSMQRIVSVTLLIMIVMSVGCSTVKSADYPKVESSAIEQSKSDLRQTSTDNVSSGGKENQELKLYSGLCVTPFGVWGVTVFFVVRITIMKFI